VARKQCRTRLGENVKTIDPKAVQRAFDRCTWGNTRETAADWLALLSGADTADCKQLFDRVFLESPDGTDIKALFSEEQIRTYLTGFNKPLNRSHLERRRKVWRFLYLGERLPIPELDWTLEK
jgi:hypothetical protein